MFLNENEKTARKAEARSTSKSGGASSSKSIELKSGSNTTCANHTRPQTLVTDDVNLSPASLLLLPNLAPTIDERAVGFFFSNHVVGIDVSSRGFIDHLQSHPDYNLVDNLLTSIKAVGLAGFSNVTKSPSLMIEAKKNYVVAVRLINAALQSPEDVKKDTTLLAVMILGIFETLAGRSQDALVAWAAHLKGAAALIRVRGPEQLSRPAGRRLFGQLTSSLATSCLQQEVELPEHILDLRLELDRHIDPTDITWRYHRVLLLFTNFYAKVRHGKITDVQKILNRSLELDNMLTETFSDLPDDWTFSIVHTDKDPNIVYVSYYHVYHHALAAMLWNGVRTLRVLLHQIIRGVLLKGFSARPPLFVEPSFTEQLQTSTDILYQLNRDIIASVPQHLGYTCENAPAASPHAPFRLPEPPYPRQPRMPAGPRSTFQVPQSNSSTTFPYLRTAGGGQLPWALFLVGVTDIVTEPVIRWVISTLRLIGQSTGVQQATVLADRLEHTRLPSVIGKK